MVAASKCCEVVENSKQREKSRDDGTGEKN